MEEPAYCNRDDYAFDKPTDRIGSHKYPVKLHESGICKDQWQRADQPHGNSQFDRVSYRMDAQPGCDIGKDSTGQKRQRTGQSNRPRFDAPPSDFRYVQRRWSQSPAKNQSVSDVTIPAPIVIRAKCVQFISFPPSEQASRSYQRLT